MYSSTSVPSSAPGCTASARDKRFRSISSPIVNPAKPRPEICALADWRNRTKVIDHGRTGKESWFANPASVSDCGVPLFRAGSSSAIKIAFFDDAIVRLVEVSDGELKISVLGRHELCDLVSA